VDLADGKLEAMIQKYKDRLKWIDGLGLNERSTLRVVTEDLSSLSHYICMDLDFVNQSRFDFKSVFLFCTLYRTD